LEKVFHELVFRTSLDFEFVVCFLREDERKRLIDRKKEGCNNDPGYINMIANQNEWINN